MQKNYKKILVTGSSGFIGFHLCMRLLNEGFNIVGVDNMNHYYDVALKKLRKDALIEASDSFSYSNFSFIEEDISNQKLIMKLFKKNNFDIVINLAAQAGVRYSIKNPRSYIDSNINGFFSILEACKEHTPEHLIFASSSSVYGMNNSVPFNEIDTTDNPVSLYAATKKTNELMAYTYSHLYKIPTTGLRFFTVYGPYGRPDMAYFKFTKSILEGKEIEIFNEGEMMRDFTYIDDIIESIYRLISVPPIDKVSNSSNALAPFDLFNIGNNNPVSLSLFIKTLEKCLGMKAKKNNIGMQPGDVLKTFAEIESIKQKIKYHPKVSIDEGLQKFVDWYKNYSC